MLSQLHIWDICLQAKELNLQFFFEKKRRELSLPGSETSSQVFELSGYVSPIRDTCMIFFKKQGYAGTSNI